ncbi:MAG: hypothetical protein ACC683_11350 [Acidimicrobiia bacterium]
MLLVALAVVAASTATARSQVTIYLDGLPDGNYSGGIYFHVGTAKLDLDGRGALTTSTDEEGDARITMDSDEPSLSGEWLLEGSSDIGGTFSFNGVSGTASGSTINVGSGTFTGTPLEGRLIGTTSSEGSWNFDGPQGSLGPFRAGGPDTFDEPLTDVMNRCSQLVGRWGSELAAKIEARGPNLEVRRLHAYFILSDEVVVTPESPMSDTLRELAERGNEILADIRLGGDSVIAIVDGAHLLREIETLQAEIAEKESECPADKKFLNALTQVAQDALDAVLEAFEQDPNLNLKLDAEQLRMMIRLALGTGATGSGALDTVRAAELDARMEAQVNKAFDEATESYVGGDNPTFNGDKATFDEAMALAALGAQQGWKVESADGVTGDDILNADRSFSEDPGGIVIERGG